MQALVHQGAAVHSLGAPPGSLVITLIAVPADARSAVQDAAQLACLQRPAQLLDRRIKAVWWQRPRVRFLRLGKG